MDTGSVLQSAGQAFSILKWGIYGIILLAVLAIGIGWWVNKKKYCYLIEVWGISGGIPDVIGCYKAKPLRVKTHEGVASLLWVKALKRHLKMPPRDLFRGNKVRYWFGKDGELRPLETKKVFILNPFKKKEFKEAEDADCFIPLSMEDVNKKMAVMNVNFINENMRLTYVATGKIVRETFNLHKFFKEYGHTILLIVGFLVMAIGIVIMFDAVSEYYKSAGNVAGAIDKTSAGLEAVNEKLVSLLERMNILNKATPPGT